MIAYFLGGCAIYGIVLFVLVMLRPKSALHTKKLTDCGRREKITIGVVLVILILLCTLPMLSLIHIWKILGSYNSTFSLLPSYIGDIPLEVVKKD